MKIQCDVCERAEATVLCCADEAALCWGCDDKVHAANKLAGKHQRVPLLKHSSTQIPKCDICQEKAGYFFCLEDRALLCRKCDVSIHTATPYVSSHQRFLVTGVKVGLHQSPMTSVLAQADSSPVDPSPAVPASATPLRRQQCQNSFDLRTHVEFRVERMSGFSADWPLNEMMFTATTTSSSDDHNNGFFLGFPEFSSNKVDSPAES